LKTTCSTTEGWNWRAHKVLPPAFWNLTRLEVKSGDSIITKAGPRHRVGVASFVDFVPPQVVPSGKMICLRPNPERVLPAYLALALSDSRTQRYLDQRTTGMAESQVNFENNALLGAPVWLPERDEQERIVEALTGPTAAATSLERLIAKKQAIKQGMMQQLLTGKTRLPGFEEPWRDIRIKELVSSPVTDGPHLTPQFHNEGVPFLSVNNIVDGKIDWSDVRYISKADHAVFSQKCKPRRGDVLLGKAASVGKVALVDTDVDMNIWSPIALIRPSEHFVPEFVYFQLQSDEAARQIGLLTNTSSQGNIGMGDIERISLLVPEKSEQVEIARVLDAATSEITHLQKQLKQIKRVKMGMVQELLTGRTRLNSVGV